MYISKLHIENYRGIKEKRTISLDRLSSIVGKNDAGKTIILSAIATFLDIKNFPITYSDFNNIDRPIIFEFELKSENLKEILLSKLSSKIKKEEGLEDYLNDLIFNDAIFYRKSAVKVDKKFSSEAVSVEDFVQEDIRGLYFKSDKELDVILNRYDIKIPVQGIGRNSKIEKIKYIKVHFSAAQRSRYWIDDNDKISVLFPQVEMFKADYGLEADAKFKTTSVSEIQDYFDNEISEDESKLKKVELEIIEEMKKEAQSITKYMKDYTSVLKEVQITPVLNWKDAIKNVDVSFQFDGDEKFIPMTHKGTGYRRLFMVARFRYLAEKNKGKNIIYLIEEPETFLHPTAQQDLLNAFKALSDDNQIILTTHSPIFAGATTVTGVVLCTKELQSNYENCLAEDDNSFLMKIVDELGIKPSFNLRDYHKKILFVESMNDAEFYNFLTDSLLNLKLLNINTILVLPFGGGENIESFLNIDYFDRTGRELYLIIDRDKHKGNELKQIGRAQKFKDNKEQGKSYVLKKNCIENYYHPRALERIYNLNENILGFFADDENVKDTIKKLRANGVFGKQNVKEKNALNVFAEMTKEEWIEVAELELIDFLRDIVS